MRRNMFAVSPRRCAFHYICKLLTTVGIEEHHRECEDEFYISMVCRLDPLAVRYIYAWGAR